MLSDGLLETRFKHISETEDLNTVMDVLFVCYKDPDALDVIGLPDNLKGLTNNPKLMAETLLENPEKVITGLTYEGEDASKKRDKSRLDKVVYCRTNPGQKNDLHLTIYYNQQPPFEIALLDREKNYSLVSDEQRIQLLGK